MRALVATVSLLAVLVAATSTGAAQSESCVPRGSDSKGHRTTHKAAKRVVDRYSLETMKRCDGVVGMGVGAKTEGNRPPAADEKVHHITIFLRDAESKPPNTRSIAGVRIVWRVTGEFTAY
jgi:hypothetical protein